MQNVDIATSGCNRMPRATHLRKGEILRLRDGDGQRIESIDGGLWITIDDDRRDIVIDTGEAFTVDRSGDTLVCALDDATLLIVSPSRHGAT
jgi:hypothetical protein